LSKLLVYIMLYCDILPYLTQNFSRTLQIVVEIYPIMQLRYYFFSVGVFFECTPTFIVT